MYTIYKIYLHLSYILAKDIRCLVLWINIAIVIFTFSTYPLDTLGII